MDAPLARTPANFEHKSCFLVSYPHVQVVYQILKLLASTVGGPKFLHAPLAQTQLILALKVVFGKRIPYPSCVKILSQCASIP